MNNALMLTHRLKSLRLRLKKGEKHKPTYLKAKDWKGGAET
jgi:hypothetical protein